MLRPGSFMNCRICGRLLEVRLSKHLNSSHKTSLAKYFEEFPDEYGAYLESKRPV